MPAPGSGEWLGSGLISELQGPAFGLARARPSALQGPAFGSVRARLSELLGPAFGLARACPGNGWLGQPAGYLLGVDCIAVVCGEKHVYRVTGKIKGAQLHRSLGTVTLLAKYGGAAGSGSGRDGSAAR